MRSALPRRGTAPPFALPPPVGTSTIVGSSCIIAITALSVLTFNQRPSSLPSHHLIDLAPSATSHYDKTLACLQFFPPSDPLVRHHCTARPEHCDLDHPRFLPPSHPVRSRLLTISSAKCQRLHRTILSNHLRPWTVSSPPQFSIELISTSQRRMCSTSFKALA